MSFLAKNESKLVFQNLCNTQPPGLHYFNDLWRLSGLLKRAEDRDRLPSQHLPAQSQQ